MVVKKLADLGVVVKAAKTLEKITQAVQPDGGSFWDKLPKIIDGVNSMLETAAKYQQQVKGGGAPLPLGRADVFNERPAPREPQPKQIPPQPGTENLTKGIDENMNAILNAFIQELGLHVEKCRKENPNMTAGEVISKIDFLDVTQLSGLLFMARKYLDGKK